MITRKQQRNRIDHKQYESEAELRDAVKKHFGVHTEFEHNGIQNVIWLCGSTGKKIIGITYNFTKDGGYWYIGGFDWSPDLFE